MWLGWSNKKYGLCLYAPVGEYDNDNIGLGFSTAQLQGAGYYYLDEQKASALMLSVTYETHSEIDGTNITLGDHLTVEYGFSQYLSENLEVGLAGYSQWQVEDEKGNGALLDMSVKTKVKGASAQLAYWVTPQLNFSAKLMKEYDADARFEGEWAMFNITYIMQ